MILIDQEDESKTNKKSQSVKEIAEIMVENMKANTANPNFWAEKEERLQKAREEVLKKRKEKHKNKN